MRIATCAFTKRGALLAARIGGELFAPGHLCAEGFVPMGELAAWAASAFADYDALVFVGAVGIAVRAIAPHVRDKAIDPAVVCVDELGRHVIPILSGHIGGANALALRLARRIGGEAVITTATDLSGVPAIDSWAVERGMCIENPRAIAPLSAAALERRDVGVAITERRIEPPFPVTLWLRPRTLTVGVGCKKGTEGAHLEECFFAFLNMCQVSPLSVCALASIDAKADEPAIRYLAGKYRLESVFYTAQQLEAVEGGFASSAFVRAQVGVDNVCERACVLHSGGRLLMGKTKYEGVTLALASSEGNL